MGPGGQEGAAVWGLPTAPPPAREAWVDAAAEAESTCDARETGPHSTGCRVLQHARAAWGHQGSLPQDTQMAHTVPLPRPWRAATGRQEAWSHLCPLSLHLFFTIPQGMSCTPESGSSPRPGHHRHASPLLTLPPLSRLRGRLSIQDHLRLPALSFQKLYLTTGKLISLNSLRCTQFTVSGLPNSLLALCFFKKLR